MKSLVALLFLLLSVGASFAQPAGASSTVRGGGWYQPLGYCQITVLSSAVPLATASCSTGSVPNGANFAVIGVETAGVRYRDDGVAPTTTLGMPAIGAASAPFYFQYASGTFGSLQFIAISGSPVINVLFYK